MPVVRPGVIRETIIIEGEINNVFDFMSDFSNSPLWDPGVVSAKPEDSFDKLMITVGTGYDLVVDFNGSEMDMTYHITKYTQPNEVILEGEGKTVKARDIIKFKKIGNNQIEIDYQAELTLKSWRRPFIFFIYRSLNKIGESAKRGIENYFKYGNKDGNKDGDSNKN